MEKMADIGVFGGSGFYKFLDDIKEVQKQLLNAIFTEKVEYKEFNDNSVLKAKEYFVSICKKYEIEPSDLFFDDDYQKVLKKSLIDLYNGKVENVDESVQEDFVKHVKETAEKNNITVEQLLKEQPKLLF